jgi:chaperonin GroES
MPMPASPTGAAQDMGSTAAPEEGAYGQSNPNNTFIDKVLESVNIAEDMDEKELDEIGALVVDEYKIDEASRKDWMDRTEEWTKLATQVAEKKNWPWKDAANVKYPLVTTAAMQFAARAYPSLIPGLDVVRMRVIGQDQDGQKAARASRVEKHMSYQVLEQMETWEEDMDKACMIVAIVGCVFKKTFHDTIKKCNHSTLVHAKDLVVNYYAPSLEEATRKTHLLYKTPNEVKEKQLNGVYLDIELEAPKAINPEFSKTSYDIIQASQPPSVDKDAPRTILEQHRWLDLDDDDYKEPYIVTVDLQTKKVLRIVARFEKDGVKTEGDKVVCITPIEYFTLFPFIPNPDGGFYPLGFGALLGPLNETVNTLINQLLDSGTMSTLQAGFLSRGIRMKTGRVTFEPGEWKVVNATGDDLRKGIFPLPTKEPSTVLFQLLGTIVQSGKELASIAEIFVGKMPGQNTPATTTMATVEQGMKVFTAIYKRLFRALKKEYQKLYRLNRLYLDPREYFVVLDGGQTGEVYQKDYEGDETDIRPAADPQAVSEIQKLAKAQGLLELVQLGTVNKQEVTKRVLEAMNQENIPVLMQVEPQVDPEIAKVQAEMQMKQQEAQMKMQFEKEKHQLQMQAEMLKLQLKEKEIEMKMQELQMKMQMQVQQAHVDVATSQITAQNDMQIQNQQHEQNMQMAEDEHHMNKEQAKEQHGQKLEQGNAAHQQKMQQTKEAQKVKPKPTKK